MAVQFKVPKSTPPSVQTISEFLGVDFTNSTANIDIRRSPNGQNMLRDVPGKVRKSMGWTTQAMYGGKATNYSGDTEYEIEKFINSRAISNLVITAVAEDLTDPSTPDDVVVEIENETESHNITIPLEDITDSSDTYGSDGLRGYGTFLDTIDCETGKLTRNVFYMEYTALKMILLLSDVAEGTVLNIVTKKDANNLYYTGTVWKSGGKYNWNITDSDDYNYHYENQSSMSGFPITDGDLYYMATGLSKEVTLTIAGYPTTGYLGYTKISSDKTLAFTAYVYDTESVEPIYGYHALRGDSEYIIHAGKHLYHGNDVIYSDMNDARSTSWQVDEKLYILDGKCLLVYYQEDSGGVVTHKVETASKDAYIPTVTISKDPNGGGTSYEDLNLLQPGFTEQFLGQAGVTEYQLSFDGLDDTEVTAQVLGSDGEWVDKVENTDFTVDRSTGTITFNTAPGASPVTGEDNVKITAYRTVEGYADRINKCRFGTLYGANGANDRLFISGNPDKINYDWWSAPYDFAYFADTAYSRLGSDNSAIMGYSVISSALATHKDKMERAQNIIMRTAYTDKDDKVWFKVSNTLQGEGAVAPFSFAYLQTEPLFLTNQGIFAVTPQDITGERYSQNRSFFLNGKLLKEDNKENAFACVHDDMYWLCLNGVAYILDGLQSMVTDKSAPYSTRQYAGFYRTNIPANTMWVKDKVLWFGTSDGRVCKFATDKYALASYNDDGEPIEAIWETPDIDGDLFYKNKTLRYVAIRAEAAVATSVKIYAMERGLWGLVKEDDIFGRFLMFSQLVFSKFSFSCDQTQRICRTKVRVKKVDKFRLKFVNDKVDEPFALYDVAMEYVEKGNFKG